MLSTDITSDTKVLHIESGGKMIQFNSSISPVGNYHLYIISDEEIKEGDWFLNITKNTIHQCNEVNNNICSGLNHGEYHGKFECRKIIASTDSNLMLRFNDGSGFYTCPQPSQEFIDKYINEYNKGNVVTDVLVEYILEHNLRTSIKSEEFKEVPRIDKDNTITIEKVKDSWNREEVIALMKTSIEQAFIYPETFTDGICLNTNKSIKWIEDNL